MSCSTTIRVALIALCVSFRVGGATAEDEPFSVSLLDADSHLGWDYGSCVPEGWTIADGRLRGAYSSTPLISGWTVGNFELRFRWATSEGGAWRLALVRIPSGQDLDLRFAEGDSCGAILDGRRLLASGGRVPRLKQGMHTAVVRRAGTVLAIWVDARPMCEVEVRGDERFGLGLSVTDGEGAIEDLRLEEPAGRPIFNGVDLAGWWCDGNPRAWEIVDGELVCRNRRGNYLRTENEYANYTLSFEYKMRRGGNSGVGIRTARNGWPSGDGIEMQLYDEPPGTVLTRSSNLGLYGNLEPVARADASEQWNRVVVKCDGYLVSGWVNGVLVQHANTASLPELRHRHLKGWIGFQDHGAWIRLRNVNVLEAPEGQGMSAWYERRPDSGSCIVLDRLMNTTRLAVDDGTSAGIAVASLTQACETVLADLAGPGALVGLSASDTRARLAFYFGDGEHPAIECPISELGNHVPRLDNDLQPLATFVGYKDRLKIVLRADGPVECRAEYVTFPTTTPVRSFSDGAGQIERGLLPAISYRYDQLEGGRHREEDPLERHDSGERTIEPGSTVPLMALEGAGVVQWLKLKAPREAFADDGLWLEITVDGEMQPAIAAPARFLFPGLQAGGGNYANFVMLYRNGYTSLLAMPFGKGLSIQATNRSSRPIDGVAVAVSVEQTGSQPMSLASLAIASGMRLRGVFHLASDSPAGDIFRYEGKGRWVALVYEPPNGADTPSASLLIHDEAFDDWWSGGLDELAGRDRSGGEFRGSVSGRHGGLVWRYMLLAPPSFKRSIVLRAREGEPLGSRLALFYATSN